MSNRLRILLLAVLLAGFGLRVWRLDYQELRGDEAFGFFFSQQPYADIVAQTLALREPHPVASYFVQRAWLGLSGSNELALRYVSVWFSIVSIALLYRLARQTGTPHSIAIASAVLLGISPYVVWHGQDARMYSMSLALTLASSWLGLAWLERRSIAIAAAYVAISVLALHTHYFAVFILLAQSLYVALLPIFDRIVRKNELGKLLTSWALMQTAVALLYAPWLIAARHVLLGYVGNGDSPTLGAAVLRSFSVFAGGESTPAEFRPALAIVALVLATIGLGALLGQPRTRNAGLWYALYLTVPILATWAGATSRPIFDERYLAAAVPPFYVLVASSLIVLQRRADSPASPFRVWVQRVVVVALSSVLVLGLGSSLVRHYTDAVYSKTRGWRVLAERLDQLSACVPADQVRLVQNYPDPTLWYYYDGPVEHLVLPPVAHGAEESHRLTEAMADANVRRILFVSQPAANWDDAGTARQALEASFIPAAETEVGAWSIVVYAAPLQNPDPAIVEFQNGVRLTRFSADPESIEPGGALIIHTEWELGQAGRTLPLKVFLQLLNREGGLVAQQDQALVTGGAEAAHGVTLRTYGILLPGDLDAGDYTLIVGLYYPDENGAPRVPTMTGADHAVMMAVDLLPAGGCAESVAVTD